MALQFGSNFTFASKKTPKTGGVAATPTYDPNSQTGVITAPLYREHQTDIFSTRSVNDAREMLVELFKSDPDVSAAVNGYLTLANTEMVAYVVDLEGEIDREASKQLDLIMRALTWSTTYENGFQLKPSMNALCESFRWMLLLRGAIGAELVFDKTALPDRIRNIDMATIEWVEKKAGEYKPQQDVGGSDKLNLDIPTFFVEYFRRDPLTIYGYPFFLSAINTIAARQMIINDLYRIMQITGYPRIDITVIEEVLQKNVPPSLKTDDTRRREWVNARYAEIRSQLQSLRPDQPMVHSDAIEIGILNDKAPGVGIDISKVIDTLNAQNQAGLKSMATILGRGTQGVNTGSVEARVAAMNADELNYPIGELLSRLLSFILHQNGYQGFAVVYFVNAELRPDLELEPQLALRAARLRTDLSLGLITDDEYHLLMHNRIRPDSAPELSGTGFENAPAVGVDAEQVSPNGDPLGRGLSGEGSSAAKGNAVKGK